MADARLLRRTAALRRLLSARDQHRRGRHHVRDEVVDDSVLYVVMGSAAAAERAVLQYRTWCRHAHCAFATDDARNISGRYDAGMRLLHMSSRVPTRTSESCCANATSAASRAFFCSSHRSKTLAAQYRFLPALQWAKRQLHASPRLQWVVLVDDDSFLFPRGMLRVLREHNGSDAVHLGDFWPDETTGAPQYACGGGGSIFSRGALAQMDLAHCIRSLHRQCSQSDWMIGECARAARVRLVPNHGCTCRRWDEHTEADVRARLSEGSCSFFQFPNSPGSRGGPFKDLMALLRTAGRPGPAVVHQLDRLV